nr:hypothetical protein [Tanacetum cinerariifolium]
TNVFNALQELVVVKKAHGVNPPHIDECCCECGNALDGIFCQQCTCKSCGKGAHVGYNCPPKVSIISNLEPCNQTMNNELQQTLPSFDSTYYFDKENSVPCVSKPNFVDESSNIFNPPPQPPIYYYELCGSIAQYGHYCIPQASFINPEPGYSKDFNFLQDIYDFQQQYLCCDQCGGPHETFQLLTNLVIFTHNNIVVVIPAEVFMRLFSVNRLTRISIIPILQVLTKPNPRRKFNRYSFFETPKVLLLAWDRVFEIKDALETKQYKPEDIQELFRQLLNDVQSIHEELAEYINTPGWNHPDFYDDDDDDDVDYTIAIALVLSTEEPASPPDSELISSEVMEIVIPEFPPTDRSDFTHEEFADELAHIKSPPEYDCFYFRNLPDPGELMFILNSGIRENLSSTTCVNLPVEDWKRIRLKRDKFEQNRTKTGSVAKPG